MSNYNKSSKFNKYDSLIIKRFTDNPKKFSASKIATEILGSKDNQDHNYLKVYAWRLVQNLRVKEGKSGKIEWYQDESKGTANLSQVVDKQIKSLDDLVKACSIDLDEWEVERWVCNSWGVTAFPKDQPLGVQSTNYQVKAWLKKREKSLGEVVDILLPSISSYTPKNRWVKRVGKTRVGVANFADFHFGAKVKDLLRTRDFNLEILIEYLSEAVAILNSYKFSEVHVNMLGDFFESLSGINHENTFKSLAEDGWGGNVMILANEIIGEHLLSKIVNLSSVNIVSGNHDRMTASNKVDNTGEGGKILWYMIKKDFPDIPVRYHNSVLSVEIDGINYLLTHGDKGYSKKEFSKFVLDYGKPSIYNVILEGHLHSRIYEKAVKAGRTQYEDIEAVSMDDVGYRKIICPSIFTGNWFSESLGFSSAAGMIICENNGKGQPHAYDISL